MEEQGLADGRLHGFRKERLRDQICRLGTLAGEELFRVGGHENDGDIEAFQYLGDGLEAGAALTQVDVGKNETGALLEREFDGLLACRGRGP